MPVLVLPWRLNRSIPEIRGMWPWKEDDRSEELEARIDELEEELDRCRERFKAEDKRRSELARKKQESEEELNRLRDQLRNLKDTDRDYDKEETTEMAPAGFKPVKNLVRRLSGMESDEKDLVTVYATNLEEIDDFKGLKNSLSGEAISTLKKRNDFIAFTDDQFINHVIATRPFFEPSWTLDTKFDTGELLEFIQAEKHWALVSAGNTRIFHEENGVYQELDPVKSRVDHSHSQGGFSQGRFERKREEQVKEHLERVEERVKELENVKLLGERRHCKQLTGDYLGGFDPQKEPPEVFYNFRVTT